MLFNWSYHEPDWEENENQKMKRLKEHKFVSYSAKREKWVIKTLYVKVLYVVFSENVFQFTDFSKLWISNYVGFLFHMLS